MPPQPSAGSAAAPAIRVPGSRRPLDRQFILTGALDIIDTHGAEGLTMRALAAHLESGTTTLYRHFRNRAALIAAVTDRVLGKIDTAAPVTAAVSETLRRGSKGDAVKRMQAKLGLTADGDFGPGTEAALKKWQAANGLTADGVVGPKTLAKLLG
jgi:AcrR family transcriptional regulator